MLFRSERGQEELNGKLSEAETMRHCLLDDEAQASLETARERLGLSARSLHKVLRVARTIADLAQARLITKEHMVEALSFRKR